jgi:uncharacterized damage-inducible protein DinB
VVVAVAVAAVEGEDRVAVVAEAATRAEATAEAAGGTRLKKEHQGFDRRVGAGRPALSLRWPAVAPGMGCDGCEEGLGPDSIDPAKGGAMGWKEILRAELEVAYRAAGGLIDGVDAELMAWKPATGENWMTTGQLLYHLSDSCGSMFVGFVSGEWDFGDGESLPSVVHPVVAKERLTADRAKALGVLDGLSESELTDRHVAAPWQKVSYPLGFQLSQMIDHLNSHKSQLFYYLKLQGKPVGMQNLWGSLE